MNQIIINHGFQSPFIRAIKFKLPKRKSVLVRGRIFFCIIHDSFFIIHYGNTTVHRLFFYVTMSALLVHFQFTDKKPLCPVDNTDFFHLIMLFSKLYISLIYSFGMRYYTKYDKHPEMSILRFTKQIDFNSKKCYNINNVFKGGEID